MGDGCRPAVCGTVGNSSDSLLNSHIIMKLLQLEFCFLISFFYDYKRLARVDTDGGYNIRTSPVIP